jgi:hypothetical protein
MPHPLTLHRRNPWLACARQRQAASTTSARHVRCRAAQKSGNQSSSSSTTTTTTTDASPRSALTLAVAMAAAAAPVTYSLLSRVEQLPSLLQLQQAAQALVTLSLGGGALALGALKLQHGDKFHLELHRCACVRWRRPCPAPCCCPPNTATPPPDAQPTHTQHRGRVHLQLGVPSAGPAVPPGCVVTRPTGDVRGNGAFAAAALPSGAHIGDYSGEVLTNTAFFERYPDGVVRVVCEGVAGC